MDNGHNVVELDHETDVVAGKPKAAEALLRCELDESPFTGTKRHGKCVRFCF